MVDRTATPEGKEQYVVVVQRFETCLDRVPDDLYSVAWPR